MRNEGRGARDEGRWIVDSAASDCGFTRPSPLVSRPFSSPLVPRPFSPRPGRIVREFRVDLPRPRSLEDHALVDAAADIVTVLREAISTHEQEGNDG